MKQSSVNALIISILLSFCIPQILTRTAEEWKSRSVYQIITDRFAKTNGDSAICDNLGNYCGGTFKGIQNNLDYIQGMGFDAIWISPVVANQPGGYHGYWASNLYEINENFGTEEELHELIRDCHERDIYVMVDIVANHMGYVTENNYSLLIPFNEGKYYNDYRHCDEIDFGDQNAVETCWLNGLPDLNQNDPYVRRTFLEWVHEFVNKWNFDALRIDTVPHVSKGFWAAFSKASGVYTIGEVLNFDLNYLASYQGSVESVLNYALYSTLRYTFQNGGSMHSIQSYYDAAFNVWPDITILGNFVNNHDNPRFLSASGNVQAFKSALAFTICSVGIPMVYYGDEQAYGGGMDPANREPLWTNMNQDSDIYSFLAAINGLRKRTRFWDMDQVQRYSDDAFYAFTRGMILFAFTNSNDYQSRSISFHPYPEGTVLCNLFHKGDCVTVTNGQIPVVLINGEVKIFVPALNDAAQPIQASSKGWQVLRNLIGNSISMNSKSLSMM